MKTSLAIVILWIGGLGLMPPSVAGQPAKVKPYLSLSYFKVSDDVPYLQVQVRKRVDRRYLPMEGVRVRMYFGEESAKGFMGEAVSDEKGIAKAQMANAMMTDWHALNSLDFFAAVDSTDTTESADESLTVTKARLEVHTVDSTKQITAVLEKAVDNGWEAVAGTEVKLFVKRDFGKLPVTDDYLETNDSGAVSAPLKATLPGDSIGRLTVGAFVEDSDDFGNIIAYASTRWGTPTVDDNSAFYRRSLWATRDRTPLWLLIFPNLIILGVWGIIVFLVFEIFKIKRLSKL